MAKTAADYIAEGRAFYATNPGPMPYAHAKSWQQRAVNQGFMDAFQEAADANAVKSQADAIAENQRLIDAEDAAVLGANETPTVLQAGEQVMTFVQAFDHIASTPAKIVKTDIPPAVIAHINFLARARAMETNEDRRRRLIDKSIALKNKWVKRVFAAHAREHRT